MRLGINGFFWTQETTGTGQYTRQLLAELLRHTDTLRCLVVRPKAEESRHLGGISPSALQERFIGPPIPLGPDLSKVWFEQISFPRTCLAEDVQVAHVPYFGPPYFTASSTVATIHDLIPLVLPGYRGSALVRLYTRLAASGARRLAAIITDSESSRQDILRLLRVSPDAVHVIYLGVDSMFKPVTDEPELEEVRVKYGLPRDYILYLGGFDRRKNLATLFAAYASLGAALTARFPLVVAGRLPGADSEFRPDPRALAERVGLEDRVIFTGWVPEVEKPGLYSGATLFVFPSLYEGFGLPVLEAMSCGTAVVSSAATSLAEIAADAALLVNPKDVGVLAGAMADLLKDGSKRDELAGRGLERAQLFSWDKTISGTIDVYRSLADGTRAG
jgi:glycosyltransferase involved in cell wall biosynthesis